MQELYKYTKEESITYFEKVKPVSIDDIVVNDIVYLKIESPLKYGIRELKFYGKIIKITKEYFYIIPYCNAVTNDWKTSQIEMLEKNIKKYTKQWSKKRILELYLVNTKVKNEIREYKTNNSEYVDKY